MFLSTHVYISTQHTQRTKHFVLFHFLSKINGTVVRGLDEIQVQNNVLRRFTHTYTHELYSWMMFKLRLALRRFISLYREYAVAIAKMYVRIVYICMRGLVGWLARRTAKAAQLATRPERAHKPPHQMFLLFFAHTIRS